MTALVPVDENGKPTMRLAPIKLVASSAEIEHLDQAEAAHQFHLASMLIEEETARHAAAVKSLQDLANELRPRVAPVDRDLLPSDLDPNNPNSKTNPSNAARIRESVRLRRGVTATNAAPATAS